MQTMSAPVSHAESNAQAWSDTIAAAYEAYQFCTEGGEGRDLSREAKAVLKEHGHDGDNLDEVAEAIEEQMRESILSITVRSNWQTPDQELSPGEFQILLSWGGPALRVMGELDDNAEPCRYWVEHQDWGTPWTLWPNTEAYAITWFVGLFWYGDA